MYVRKTQRWNKDGSVVRYVQLATNRRVGGTTQADVLLNLGREDKLDLDSLRRLVASLNRYLGDTDVDVAEPLGVEGGPLEVVASRPIGAVWLLDGLWKLLGIDQALARVLDARRFRTDVERALFAQVTTAIRHDRVPANCRTRENSRPQRGSRGLVRVGRLAAKGEEGRGWPSRVSRMPKP
ncbi:hypothetical protein ACIRYZ_41055 [Kitasatospora sp. NPDC101155]|uniref:hypothetical protein n=1 Tax=Kitasatospora sp. NPDC101155 TaxID=3364097 RepID=UPI0038044816